MNTEEYREENNNEELEQFKEEIEYFFELCDCTKEETYNEFVNRCMRYNEKSLVPYSLYCYLLDEGLMEGFYLQALMEVYCMYGVTDDFLDTLQKTLEYGCNEKYIEYAHGEIADHIKDGYVIAYRGEFTYKGMSNKDYTESVSYTLDYDEAKFFATRFKGFGLEKSVVYTVKVPVEDIVGFNDRESEVVCIPVVMGGKMEIIKTDDFIEDK